MITLELNQPTEKEKSMNVQGKVRFNRFKRLWVADVAAFDDPARGMVEVGLSEHKTESEADAALTDMLADFSHRYAS